MPEVGNVIRSATDLVMAIEQRIAGGELAPGDRIDPVRSVASSLGLAPNTVAAAYRALGERGYLVGQGRRGTFVAARPAVSFPTDERVPDGLIDLASGNPDPDLLPPLGPALGRMSHHHELYGTPSVDAELAAHFRTDLQADGVETSHLAIVGGALDGLERVLSAHLRQGDKVAMEDPGYPAVAELLAAMGLVAVPMAVDDRGPVPESLAVAMSTGIAAVIITPRAQNPTGAAIDPSRAAVLIDRLADAPDLLVIEDDHAGPVAGMPYQHLIDPARTRWATVRSVAKSLGPDLRLAALAGDSTTVGRVVGRQVLGTGWVSHLLQRLVIQLVGSPEVQAQLDLARRTYAERRAVVIETLRGAGIEVGGRSGFNVWVPVDDEAHVVAGMERRGYAIRSGARFRQISAPGIRISAAHSDGDTLLEATTALVEVIGARQRSRSV